MIRRIGQDAFVRNGRRAVVVRLFADGRRTPAGGAREGRRTPAVSGSAAAHPPYGGRVAAE